jgi:hypothetical protein
MERFSRSDARAQAVRGAAERAALAGVWQWIRERVRLVEDSELAQGVPGVDAAHAEVLIRPADMLRMDGPAGDCDDQAMLAASMLAALGIPSRFVTIAADPADLSQYSHVYLMACPSSGPPVPFDVSHGPRPGWQPAAQGKKRAWSKPAMTLRAIDWGALVSTGVQTTGEILKARYGQPPPGTYQEQRNGTAITYRQLPGTALQFPTTQITGQWGTVVLFAVVGLVLILAIRGRG